MTAAAGFCRWCRSARAASHRSATRSTRSSIPRIQPSPRMPLLLSSPYLNPPTDYINRLLQPPSSSSHPPPPPAASTTTSSSSTAQDGSPPDAPTLLSSSPTASGFWGAGGIRYHPLCVPGPRAKNNNTRGREAAAKQQQREASEDAPLSSRRVDVSRKGPLDLAAILLLLTTTTSSATFIFRPPNPYRDRLVESQRALAQPRRRALLCLVTTDASVREQLHEEQKRLRLHAKDAAEAEHGGPLTAMVARALAALLRTFF